jgi:hypothetical protein
MDLDLRRRNCSHLLTFKQELPFLLSTNPTNWQGSKEKTSSIQMPNLKAVTKDFLKLHMPRINLAFLKLTAIIKGHLTRQLLRSLQVQNLRKSIKDCIVVAKDLYENPHYNLPSQKVDSSEPQSESDPQAIDNEFRARVIHHLALDLIKIHEIFFEWPVEKKIQLISSTREWRKSIKERAAKYQFLQHIGINQ